MNTKTLNVYLKKDQTIPIILANLVESNRIKFYITGNTNITIAEPLHVSTKLSILFQRATTFVTNLVFGETTYELLVSGSAGDCTGRELGSVFTGTSNQLYVGSYGSTINKSWIPFPLTFNVGNSIHLNYGELIVVPASNQYEPYINHTPCSIKVACENVANSASPISWDDLNGRIMTNAFLGDSNVSAWTEGTAQRINITSSLQELLGTNAIRWNDGETLAVILRDYGSYPGHYRDFISYEGSLANPDYNAPIL